MAAMVGTRICSSAPSTRSIRASYSELHDPRGDQVGSGHGFWVVQISRSLQRCRRARAHRGAERVHHVERADERHVRHVDDQVSAIYGTVGLAVIFLIAIEIMWVVILLGVAVLALVAALRNPGFFRAVAPIQYTDGDAE